MSFNLAQGGQKSNSLAYNLEYACRQHMSENGFVVDQPLIFDGKIKRISIDANKFKKDEWYVGWTGLTDRGNEYLTVVYCSYSNGEKYIFSSFNENKSDITPQEREYLKREQQLRRQETDRMLEEQREASARQAIDIWATASATPPSDDHMAYCTKKGIEPIAAGFGMYQGYPSLILPLYNINRQLCTLQFIYQLKDGNFQKKFLYGGQLKGSFLPLCTKPLKDYSRVYIAEGWATCVSIFMALDKKEAVICAVNAQGLFTVAGILKEFYPHLELIVCSDNDKNEVGQTEARKVELAYGARVIVAQEHKDFNDVHVAQGLTSVAKQLELEPVIIKQTSDEERTQVATALPEPEVFRYLPDPLKKYLAAMRGATDAHPLMLLSSTLSMIAARLGNKVYMPKGEYFSDLYPNLWFLNISRSGNFKSTALNMGSTIALKKQSQLFKDLQAMVASMQLRNALPEEIMQESRKTLQQDIIMPNRTTPEALISRLEQSPSGVWYIPEFGTFMKSMTKNYNADFIPFITELYDCPSASASLTKKEGFRVVLGTTISLCAVSTLIWVKESARQSDFEGGFLYRFLIFNIPKSEKLPPALPVGRNEDLLREEESFSQCLDRLDRAVSAGRQMRFSASGKIFYNNFYETIMKDVANWDNDALESFSRRWGAHIIKVAMIMQLLTDPYSETLEAQALTSGYYLVREAMRSSSELLEIDLNGSKQEDDAQKLLKWITRRIAQKKIPVVKKDIIRSKVLSIPNSNIGVSKYYTDILSFLVDTGALETQKEKNSMADKFFLSTSIPVPKETVS